LAKLENVKVIDMVNGEPTRVEYNGAIYEKTDDGAEVGDLVRVVDGDSIGCVTQGGFYEIHNDIVGYLVFDDDDDDDERDYSYYADYLEVFRKVTTQTQPDLSERIAELERRIAALEGRGNGAVTEDQPKYRKVTDRDPRVGDYVKFDEAPCCYLTADKYYEIVEIDDFGDPQIIDDDGDEFDTGDFEFEVYELVAEGAPKFEVGDYVVALPEADDIYGITTTEMKLGKVIRIFEDGNIRIEIVDHEYARNIGDSYTVNPKYFRKTTPEEARWAKIGRKPGEFKKGDIVRYLGGAITKKGELVEVYEDTDGTTTKIKWVDDCSVCTERNNDLELICPVEHRFDREGVNA
jgi:hypothetical protein